MMSYGYTPAWSEGAIKCPIFQTSTFVFKNAEQGKAFFEVAYGLRKAAPGEKAGLIYSRINNPDLEILEDRLTLWDGAEDCATFESGMGAITTALLEFLKPGDLILCSAPLYGGTDHFITQNLPALGIEVMEFQPGQELGEVEQRLAASGKAHKLAMIYVETPANPTNVVIDIERCRAIADRFATPAQGNVPERRALVAVDNTYMGPLWQHPLKLGADLVLYSATKYIGGHSDVIAGAALGSKAIIGRIKVMRTFLGNMAGPWTGWLLLRSLETLKVRMEQQCANAQLVAAYLTRHPKVERVYYLGLLTPADGPQYEIHKKQHSAPGAMVAFDIKPAEGGPGSEAQAFRFLNALKLIKLAVSLGSTESLAEHPYTMTHAGVGAHHKAEMNITEKLIRLSVGVEHYEDILWDIGQALEAT